MYVLKTASAILLGLVLLVGPATTHGAEPAWRIGFGRADITPEKPLRLSGYGNRTEPFTGVDESLHVRAMALQADEGPAHLLISCDTIGLPGSLVESMARSAMQQHALQRQQLVFCFTHAHTAPHITNGLTNIFAKPLTDQEKQDSQAYTDNLAKQTQRAIAEALASRQPGKLEFLQGRVTFAENRRLLRDGRWVGFGVNPDGPVDHTLPLLKISGSDGKVRGLVFNYACHCTTFDSNHNAINGDWAGYAAEYLEQAFPGTCALCTIGCGADANPPRDRDKSMEFAQAEGQQILEEAKRLLSGPAQPITQPITSRFGHADLPFELPAIETFKEKLNDGRAQARAHAQQHAGDRSARRGAAQILSGSDPSVAIW